MLVRRADFKDVLRSVWRLATKTRFFADLMFGIDGSPPVRRAVIMQTTESVTQTGHCRNRWEVSRWSSGSDVSAGGECRLKNATCRLRIEVRAPTWRWKRTNSLRGKELSMASRNRAKNTRALSSRACVYGRKRHSGALGSVREHTSRSMSQACVTGISIYRSE